MGRGTAGQLAMRGTTLRIDLTTIPLHAGALPGPVGEEPQERHERAAADTKAYTTDINRYTEAVVIWILDYGGPHGRPCEPALMRSAPFCR